MTTSYKSGFVRGGKMKKMFLALFAIFLTVMVLAPQARALINEDPLPFSRNIVVFPERDFVVVDGSDYANKNVKVSVLRNGVVLSTSRGTADAAGFFEINHPGGACWTGATPDIQPGDVVQVDILTDGPLDAATLTGEGARTITRNAVITQAALATGNTVVMKGTAQDAAGNPLPVADLEARIVQPDLISIVGKRDVRAPGGHSDLETSYTGTFAYDSVDNPTGTKWTATFTFEGPRAAEAATTAAEGQSRILSFGFDPASQERVGITIFEAGELGGPGFGGCPASAPYAVTSSSASPIKAANVGTDLVLSGVSSDTRNVSVSLSDQDPATVDLTAATTTLNPADTAAPNERQTWSVTFPGGAGALTDGKLTATGTYTVLDELTSAEKTITGTPMDIQKDTVVPDAPTASPVPGTYPNPIAVSLNESAADLVKIHYTIGNGSQPAPDANSNVASGQILVSASQTIKARVIDSVGNMSPVAVFGYTIQSPAPPPPPPPPANAAPVARANAYSVNEDKLLRGVSVLRNDSDANGDPLTARLVKGTTKGKLTLRANGTFTYKPRANFFGTDSFTYRASDGKSSSNVVKVTIRVKAQPN